MKNQTELFRRKVFPGGVRRQPAKKGRKAPAREIPDSPAGRNSRMSVLRFHMPADAVCKRTEERVHEGGLHIFRMPLDGADQVVIPALEGFDDAVRRTGCREESLCQALDAFLMAGVDIEGFSQELPEGRILCNIDPVGGNISGSLLHMLDEGAGVLDAHILPERAAEGNIEDLESPADAEHGLSCFPAGPDEGKLEAVPLVIGGADAPEGLFAVKAGCRIGAAGEKKSVKERKQLFCFRIFRIGKDNGDHPVPSQRIHQRAGRIVRFLLVDGFHIGQQRIRCDGNDRFSHK